MMSFPGFVIVPDDEEEGDDSNVMTAVLDDQGKPKIVELTEAGKYEQIKERPPVSLTPKKSTEKKKRETPADTAERPRIRRKKNTNPVSYRYKCDKCTRMFAMPSQLRSHRKRVHHVETTKSMEASCAEPQEPRTFSCFMCPMIFDKGDEFEEHMKMSHNMDVLAQAPSKAPKQKLCDIEAKRIEKLESLIVQDPFVANQIVQELESLKKPPPKRRPYKAVRKHICTICQKGFPTPSMLERHNFVHTRERLFPCPHCPKRLPYSDERLRHIRRFHPEFAPWTEQAKARAKAQTEISFTCNICGDRTFHSRYRYREHLRVHLGVLYECTQCDKKYGKRDQLMRHVLSHSQDRNYGCDICQKRFIDATALKTHKRIHSKEYYHKCPICQKDFAKKRDLYYHIAKHNEETADDGLQCNVCWDKFEDKESLQDHKALHVTENTPAEHKQQLEPLPPTPEQQQHVYLSQSQQVQEHQATTSQSNWGPTTEVFPPPMLPIPDLQQNVPIPPILANVGPLYHCKFCTKAFSTFEESQLHARLHEPPLRVHPNTYNQNYAANYSGQQDPSYLQHYPEGPAVQHSRLLL